MKNQVSPSVFAKSLGVSGRSKGFLKTLHYLEKIGAIKIQQSGFRGDSLHHHKLVIVKNQQLVRLCFSEKSRIKIEQEDIEIKTKRIEYLSPIPPPKKLKFLKRHPGNYLSAKINVTELLALKHSGRQYYIVLPRETIQVYGLTNGDVLKVEIKEVFRQSLHAAENEAKPKKKGKFEEEEWTE